MAETSSQPRFIVDYVVDIDPNIERPVENLFSTKYSGLRGKKIVADLHHEKEHLILFEEVTVADIIQHGV